MTRSFKQAEDGLARRTILKGAGIGIGAGLVSGLPFAQAQTTGPAAAQAAEGPIWSAEYWARKGDVALNLWRKRMAEPKGGSSACWRAICCRRCRCSCSWVCCSIT